MALLCLFFTEARSVTVCPTGGALYRIVVFGRGLFTGKRLNSINYGISGTARTYEVNKLKNELIWFKQDCGPNAMKPFVEITILVQANCGKTRGSQVRPLTHGGKVLTLQCK